MEQLTAFSTILDTPPALTARLYGFFDKAAAFACDALAAMVEADEKKIKEIATIMANYEFNGVNLPVFVELVGSGKAVIRAINNSSEATVSVSSLSDFYIRYTDGTLELLGDAPVNKEGR